MAITLEANYSKKVGLPGYSSHQFSITLKTEIADLSQAQTESARLYTQLQDSVDQSICEVGWLPESNGSNGNGHSGDAWNCSDKQRELITKLVGEHHLDKGEVDATSHDMFGVGVKDLNKLQASGLIERILDEHGGGRKGKGARSRSTPPRRQYVNGGV